MPTAIKKTALPVLLGRLTLVEGTRARPPHLMWAGWCSFCRCNHVHGWTAAGITSRMRARDHRSPHCLGRAPHYPAGYAIGLHPDFKPTHRAVFAAYDVAAAAWNDARKLDDRNPEGGSPR